MGYVFSSLSVLNRVFLQWLKQIVIANALKYSKKLVLNRVSFWVKCLRKGLKILNSVLNGTGKSENCVLNRVRVWTPGPHLPTQASVEYPPPPPRLRGSRVTLRITRTLSLYVFQCFAVYIFKWNSGESICYSPSIWRQKLFLHLLFFYSKRETSLFILVRGVIDWFSCQIFG